MAVTSSIGSSSNPMSGVTGASIPASHLIPDVAKWADELEPRLFEVWNRCSKADKPGQQDKREFGQSYHRRIDGTIAEALDTTEVGVDLTAASGTYGDGDSIKKWNVIEIIDWQSGSTTLLDYTTREEVIVDTDPDGSNTITVKRGNGSGTGVSHSSGAYWRRVGTAMPYNRDFTLSPTIRGDKLYNRYQRFYEMAMADRAARKTPTWEFEDPLLTDFKRATIEMKSEAERTLVMGERLDPDGASGDTALPGKMGGINYYITNNSGNVTSISGPLSYHHLSDMLESLYLKTADGGAKTLLCSIKTASILDTLIHPIRQATASDTDLTLYTAKVKFRLGELEIQQTQHMPDGMILFVDFNDVVIVPYANCEWQEQEVPVFGPQDKLAIWGQYTCEVNRVARMAKIHGFTMDPLAYPRIF